MIDDVRLGVPAGRRSTFIGGISTDRSGFGVGPAARRRGHPRADPRAAPRTSRLPPIPGYEQDTYELQPHQEHATR